MAQVTGHLGEYVGRHLTPNEQDLARRALDALGTTVDLEEVLTKTHTVMRATYRDGLAATVMLTGAIRAFTVAAEGDEDRIACHLTLPGDPHPHFVFLVRQIEQLMLDGRPPYPVERTLLTGGIVDHALRNAHGVVGPATAHLKVRYGTPSTVHGTGLGLPVQALEDQTVSAQAASAARRTS